MCLEPNEEIHKIMSHLESEHIAALVENSFWVSVDFKKGFRISVGIDVS